MMSVVHMAHAGRLSIHARGAASAWIPSFSRCMHTSCPVAGMNLIEKIVCNHADGVSEVNAGEYVSVRPSYVMTHDNTAAVMPKFKSLGADEIKNPRQVVFTLDHNVQDTSEGNLAKYQGIADFAAHMGVDAYPAGRGIGHQVLCEEGYAYPFRMVVASDSHSNMYGGIGCLGTPVVRTDAACIWATGQTWWKVPKIAKVEFTGKLENGVTGKDVIVTLCGAFGNDEVLNHAVEFSGPGLKYLSIDDRLTIANMTTEWGALAGVFDVDDTTVNWLSQRCDYLEKRGLPGVPSDQDASDAQVHPRCNTTQLLKVKEELEKYKSDSDASYAVTIKVDLSTVRPHVSGPNDVKTISSVDELSKREVKVDKAYLVSCVNSRTEDLAAAAAVIKGKKVADHVQFYVAAASNEVQDMSAKQGDWETLLEAGAIPLPPGCGPCIGLGKGLLQDGEVGISATNRNFRGRMGSREAEAYLASPLVVAASAVAGYITGPDTKVKNTKLVSSIEVAAVESTPSTPSEAAAPVNGFPAKIAGRLVFCPDNDINTDGMYPGKYTYKEMADTEMASVVMENYDAEFAGKVNDGDILVVGENFGTGSSREQAATALKAAGIAAVLCGSVNQTYQRNAINNGLIVLEVPALVDALRKSMSKDDLELKTAYPNLDLQVDFVNGNITLDGPNIKSETFRFQTLGQICQQIIALGGLNGFIANELNSKAN